MRVMLMVWTCKRTNQMFQFLICNIFWIFFALPVTHVWLIETVCNYWQSKRSGAARVFHFCSKLICWQERRCKTHWCIMLHHRWCSPAVHMSPVPQKTWDLNCPEEQPRKPELYGPLCIRLFSAIIWYSAFTVFFLFFFSGHLTDYMRHFCYLWQLRDVITVPLQTAGQKT